MYNMIPPLLKKRHPYFVLSLVSAGLTLLTFALWIYNVYTAIPTWKVIFAPDITTMPRESSANVPPHQTKDDIFRMSVSHSSAVARGPLEVLLYLATVDESTVTTALVVTFFFFVARGNFRIYKSLRFQTASPTLFAEHFPFPAGYKLSCVQFGLWGTVFAFIVAFSIRR